MLMLEERERARRRGAHIYAEVLGYGTTTDAYHMTAPCPAARQAARAMTLALAEAGLGEPVGYINAARHGTPLGDAVEALAIAQVFGDDAGRLAGERHEGAARPRARRQRRDGGRRSRPSAWSDGWLPPTVNLRPGPRSATLPVHRRAGRWNAESNTRSATRSASAGSTWAWSSGATTTHSGLALQLT